MARRRALSKAEMEVARIVWDLGRATVRQVLGALPANRKVDYKTVQTYLRRLEAKGYLSGRREGRSISYSPRVRPRKVIQETVADFVNRLFDGEPFPLVEHVIREQGLTREDVQKLRQLLDQWETDREQS
jgi:predicted transcriptional regulator